MKLPGVISLRNDLPICAIPNGGFLRAYRERGLEGEEDALGGLGAQVDGRAGVLDRSDRGLEHQVELARVGEVAVRVVAGQLRRSLAAADVRVLGGASRLLEVVGAEAALAAAGSPRAGR